MSNGKFDVEVALGEVVDAIDLGAMGLKLNARTREGLKGLYRDDFKAQHDAGADWDAEKDNVIPLCFLIGASAELLTVIGAGGDADSLSSGEVDEASAYAMAILVARLHCTPRSLDVEVLRKWCQNVGDGTSQPPLALPALSVEVLTALDRLAREKKAARKSRQKRSA